MGLSNFQKKSENSKKSKNPKISKNCKKSEKFPDHISIEFNIEVVNVRSWLLWQSESQFVLFSVPEIVVSKLRGWT